MPKYKISINFETEIESKTEDEAMQEFFEKDIAMNNEIPETWLADKLEIQELDENRKCHLCDSPTSKKYCTNKSCAEYIQDEKTLN